MKICICNNVSDKDIRKLVKSGITDPVSVMQLSQAGTCCGHCVADVNELVATFAEQRESSPLTFQPIVYSPT